jgi:hypothetical protein
MHKYILKVNKSAWKMWKEIASILIPRLLLSICLAISIAPQAYSAEPKAATNEAPDVVAREFYAWYLNELSKNQDPISDSASTMKKYVSSKTLKKIHQMINSPSGMESDYFLKTQDYLDEWLAAPKSQIKRISNGNAEVIITLGGGTKSSHQISAAMLTEGGYWKIGKVTAPSR